MAGSKQIKSAMARNMIKLLYSIVFLIILSGCTPAYVWMNDDYSTAEMRDHFVVDHGSCAREAYYSYPDPVPVKNPDDVYRECMAHTRRLVRYPVTTEDGETEYRTVLVRGNPYVCTPSRQQQRYYREYENYIMRQRSERAHYVNSCLAIMGWERIPTEK
jgi:hypothetical protein